MSSKHRLFLLLALLLCLAGAAVLYRHHESNFASLHESAWASGPRPIGLVEVRLSAESLLKADAVEDAKRAFSSNDVRFVAIRAYSAMVPGVTNYWDAYASNHDLKVLSGTTDVLSNRSDWSLRATATAYARNYNQTLLRLLEGDRASPATAPRDDVH